MNRKSSTILLAAVVAALVGALSLSPVNTAGASSNKAPAKHTRHVVSVRTYKIHGRAFVPFANGRRATTPLPGTVTETHYSDGSGSATTVVSTGAVTAPGMQALANANGGWGAVPTDAQMEAYLHAGAPPAGQPDLGPEITPIDPNAAQVGRTNAPDFSVCTGWQVHSNGNIHDNSCASYTGVGPTAYHTHALGTAYSDAGHNSGGPCYMLCTGINSFGNYSWMNSGQLTDWEPSALNPMPNGCKTVSLTVTFKAVAYQSSHPECPDTFGFWSQKQGQKENGAIWSSNAVIKPYVNGTANSRDSALDNITSAVINPVTAQVGQTVWFDVYAG